MANISLPSCQYPDFLPPRANRDPVFWKRFPKIAKKCRSENIANIRYGRGGAGCLPRNCPYCPVICHLTRYLLLGGIIYPLKQNKRSNSRLCVRRRFDVQQPQNITLDLSLSFNAALLRALKNYYISIHYWEVVYKYISM